MTELEDEDTLRIGSINVNNVSPYADEERDSKLFQAIIDTEVDILLMQEIGVNWSAIPRSKQWQNRCDKVFEPGLTKNRLSCNRNDPAKTARQWGGTGVFAQGKISFYAMGSGTDKADLGRWTWARYRGKQGIVLRVVSIYQPCRNQTGAQSVYAQHRNYFQGKNDDRDPRQAFKEDFKQELNEWIEAGDQVIVGGDVNQSVTHPEIADIFSACDMVNTVFQRHGANDAPTTYYRTTSGRIVDGIWATPGIAVKKAGFLEPGDFPSDHSLLWMDITYQSALGHNPPHPVAPAARRLKLNYSKVTEKYLNDYERMITAHRLDERQFRLEASTTYAQPLSPRQAQEAEAIDFMRTKCMNKAEGRCRKLKMGKVDFSPKVAKLLRKIAFWDLAIQRRFPTPRKDKHGRIKKRKKISSRLWRRKKKAAGITAPTGHLTKEQMETRRRKAKRAYLKAKKKHADLRTSFIKTLPPKDRERLLRHEHQRKMGRYAKAVTGKLESKSVTKIEHNGQEMTTQEAIEGVLLEVNRAKTRASDETDFMTEPLRSEFGTRNNTQAAEQVLNGTYMPPAGASVASRILLAGLRTPHNIRVRNTKFRPRRYITTEDHIKAFRKAKEKTSAGMSKLHFGMFKAHIKRRRLAEMDASMRSVAYTTGYAYKRWKKGLDVQLLKRAKLWDANKLRTILLLEADFNMNNKAIGADAMRMGEHAGCFTRDNYGGRKDMQAAEVSMNAQLTFNSIWARRGRAIVMSNDAKGCYDRIAHVVVDLALRRLGIPKPALQSMLETIQEMEHHVRTAFGDSEGHYGNGPGLPPQGILQGNGAGPAGWFAISTVLIETLRKEGFGYKEWTLIKQRALCITCFAFVDDTDIIHASNDRTKPLDVLLQEAQDALSTWEELLSSTGGALAPEKSYWYLVDVVPKNGEWQYATIEETPGNLFLNYGQHQVRRQEVSQANEALGIQIRPDCCMQDQKTYLLTRVKKWCDAIRTKKLYGNEAWYCLTTTISKTIEYSLVATTFSREDIDDIMRPLFKAALRLCGLQRNLPRKLLYGPLEARGCGLKDPYYLQLIHHLTSILKHQHRNTPSADLHAENMELVQTYVGSDQNFWDLPFTMYGHLAPDGWIKNTWEALSGTTLTLKGPSIALPIQRERDFHLMDAFIQHPAIPSTNIPILQKCRLYVRATRMSDICTAGGQQIQERAWNGQPSTDRAVPNWVGTIPPTANEVATWQDALRIIALVPFTETRRLRIPLGQWLKPEIPQWTWWKHMGDDLLYERTADGWKMWRRFPSQGNYAKYTAPEAVHGTPTGALPASVTIDELHSIVTVRTTGIIRPQQQPPHCTVLQQIAKLDDDVKWAIQSPTITGSIESLAREIEAGTVVAVSDGSLKCEFGTAAFTIEHSPTTRIRGVNVVPGPIKEGDSHRCELAGLYGLVQCVRVICEVHNVTTGQITVACDNITALEVFDDEFQPHPKQANFDLTSSVYNLIKLSPIKWNHQHVKGHQDEQGPVSNLTRLERLNVEMDELAKRYWTHILQYSPLQMPIPRTHSIYGEGWQLWQGDTKIINPRLNTIYNRIYTPITQFWWRRHGHATTASQTNTDWEGMGKSLKCLTQNGRLWVTKTASENCGVGTTLVAWRYQDDAKCPRCGHDQETTEHVTTCQDAEANKVFRKSLRRLKRYFKTTHTDPRIHRALVSSLRTWRKGREINTAQYDPEIQTAIHTQTQIGWQDMVEGLLAVSWRTLQQKYYDRHRSRQTGKKWLIGLRAHLIRLGRRQWLHRNKVKHRTGRPRHLLCVHLLHEEIIKEYARGTRTLLTPDKSMLDVNLIHLLHKPIAYKQAWWSNIHKARQRFERRRRHDEEWKLESQRNSRLCQWMQGNPR